MAENKWFLFMKHGAEMALFLLYKENKLLLEMFEMMI